MLSSSSRQRKLQMDLTRAMSSVQKATWSVIAGLTFLCDMYLERSTKILPHPFPLPRVRYLSMSTSLLGKDLGLRSQGRARVPLKMVQCLRLTESVPCGQCLRMISCAVPRSPSASLFKTVPTRSFSTLHQFLWSTRIRAHTRLVPPKNLILRLTTSETITLQRRLLGGFWSEGCLLEAQSSFQTRCPLPRR